MSSLVVVVKSQLFPQVIHLNRERYEAAARQSLAVGIREAKRRQSLTTGT